MKKKVILMAMLAFCALSLIGCGTSKEEVETLNSQIEELEKENAALKEELDTSLVVEDNEPIILSGKIIVGTDIPAGSYNIKAAGNDTAGVGIYESEEARENNNTEEYKSLHAGDENNPEGDVMKSYILRDGYILELSSNTEFTKVK